MTVKTQLAITTACFVVTQVAGWKLLFEYKKLKRKYAKLHEVGSFVLHILESHDVELSEFEQMALLTMINEHNLKEKDAPK